MWNENLLNTKGLYTGNQAMQSKSLSLIEEKFPQKVSLQTNDSIGPPGWFFVTFRYPYLSIISQVWHQNRIAPQSYWVKSAVKMALYRDRYESTYRSNFSMG